MDASPQIPDILLKLIEKYEIHKEEYKRGQYNETQLRREFIDPFFKALEWDIDNSESKSERYKDVIHEDPILIRGTTEFIDYAFRIGGIRKFVVEAKKPAINIKTDAGPALQIRRYAWNAHLPLSILTDFEEFAVYDCTKKPMHGDNAATARIAYFTYTDYPEKWGWITSIFSQKSIQRGSFDKFAEGTKGKKGTATVDEAILADIEEWRDLLAKNIAIRNSALSVEELNVAVQKTIDRILFLRICEDRGIEEYGCLQKLLEGQDVYQRLLSQFHRADTRYNSGLFHFNEEPGWEEMPDRLTLGIIIDDIVLKKIIKRLYFPESPYEFSVISPVILGQVYEQFLGKIIRLTAGHQAKVEYKPEMKKAGGVYYTPQYIVDYIVQHTVGELVKDKTPREVSKIRVLDPACGSGSFLIGAYQFLLDWHLNWYIQNLVPIIADKPESSPEVRDLLPERPPKLKKKRIISDTSIPIYTSANGSTSRVRNDWKLTIAERKRILLNNIYGVDIDTQAVEVTKLSLLLKVLEEESQENVSKQLKLFEERALPSLHQNIKCGNSLIGTDIYADMQATLDDPEVVKRINAFDWDREFPEIMQKGGFDAVIGNPPYIRIQALQKWAPDEVLYFGKKYTSASTGNYDIYVIFVERAKKILNKHGRLGFILPNKFFVTDYGRGLRKIISDRKSIIRIVDFSHGQVFDQATTYTCLLFLSSAPLTSFEYISIEPSRENLFKALEFSSYPSTSISDEPWQFAPRSVIQLFNKMEKNSKSLIELPVAMNRGSSTGSDSVFMLSCTPNPGRYINSDNKVVEIEEDILRVPLFATDFNRYFFSPNRQSLLIFPYQKVKDNYVLLSESDLKTRFPSAYNYLKLNKAKLEQRKQYKKWFAFSAPRSLTALDDAQMVIPLLANKGLLAELPDNRSDFCLMASGGFSISVGSNIQILPRYILGLLNSKLLFLYLKSISNRFQGGWITCTKQYVGALPIRIINFSNPADKARHDMMVTLVERMLALHKQKADVKIDHEKTLIERQIEATDKQIDSLVYELYGLTEEEIRIVEGEIIN
jgi:hypothetical protein